MKTNDSNDQLATPTASSSTGWLCVIRRALIRWLKPPESALAEVDWLFRIILFLTLGAWLSIRVLCWVFNA